MLISFKAVAVAWFLHPPTEFSKWGISSLKTFLLPSLLELRISLGSFTSLLSLKLGLSSSLFQRSLLRLPLLLLPHTPGANESGRLKGLCDVSIRWHVV